VNQIVGVAEMKISDKPGDVIVTHALGSCLGIAAHDPQAEVGGIFHAMLPSFEVNPAKAKDKPMMFIDLGTPIFFKSLYKYGCQKERLVIKVSWRRQYWEYG